MWRKLLLLACLALCAFAEDAVSNATSGPRTAKLNGVWRWHKGDDMQWASLTFDDSNWQRVTLPGPPPLGPLPHRPLDVRFRFWIRIPVLVGKLSDPGLMIGPVASAYEVYWDGERIGSFGDVSRGQWFFPRWQIFRIPPHRASPGAHAVAVRVGGIDTDRLPRIPWLEAGDNRVGDLAGLREAESVQKLGDFQPWLFQLLFSFGLLLAGLYFLLLPPSVSQGAAFRWLGVILLSRTLIVMREFFSNYGRFNVPGSVLVVLVWALVWVFCVGLIEFSYALFRRSVPSAVRCLEGSLALLAIPVPFAYSAVPIRLAVVLIPSLVSIALAGAEFRKRTSDAGLTVILFAIFGATTLYNALALNSSARLMSGTVNARVVLTVAGFHLWYWDVALLLWVPAMTTQVYRANMRFRDERERLRGEMEAARHVQELLVPSQSIHVPGYAVDASYHPAAEVGGDFFQLFPVPDDSLLVVIGDVSGKGMKAALLVSVIVGALQNRKSDLPIALLGELNSVLLRRSEGGFTTCCCALFGSDGTLTIANAGHLAPYHNGQEIETLPGLPLGIDVNAHWSQTSIALQPGDRVLWFSDGVVEARNGKRDLLGFKRAQELATQSASKIARAAQQFGQEDDITVVSITRQPVPVYVA